jgi:hypothetical protein
LQAYYKSAATMPEVTIAQYIVHRVHQKPDPRTQVDPPPMLADVVSPPDGLVEDFLIAHIQRGQEDYRSRRATFLAVPTSNPVREQCDAIFDHLGDVSCFVDRSRTIATELAAAAQGRERADARITPGDLIVCQLAVRVDGASKPMLALLKIDAQSGFYGVRKRLSSGAIQVVLRAVREVLTDARLLKCAFVLPPEERQSQKYDLLVLDLQVDKRNASQWAASYFIDRFLQCETGLTPDEELNVLIYKGADFIEHSQALSPAEKEQAKLRTLESMYDQEINVVQLAGDIFSDPAERQRYLEHLRANKLTDLVFAPNPRKRQNLVNFVTFEGDNDLTLRVRRQDYGPGRMVTPGARPNADGSTTITVRTTRWQPRTPL